MLMAKVTFGHGGDDDVFIMIVSHRGCIETKRLGFWLQPGLQTSAMHLTVSLLTELQLFIPQPMADSNKKKSIAIFWSLRPLFNVTAD